MGTITKEKHFHLLQSPKDLQKVAFISQKRFPEGILIFNISQLTLANRYSSNVSNWFYCFDALDMDDEKNNLIVLIQEVKVIGQRTLIALCPKVINDEMLSSIDKLVDWTIPHSFGELNEPFGAAMKTLCDNHGNSVSKSECNTFYKPPPPPPPDDDDEENYNDNNNSNIDDKSGDISLKSLCCSDAYEVDSLASTKYPGTLEQVKDLIRFMGSSGVYTMEADELVSWVLLSSTGYFTILHTKEKYRRKGYAVLTLNDLARKLRPYAILPYGHATLDNDVSRKTFMKAGWVQLSPNYWLDYSSSH